MVDEDRTENAVPVAVVAMMPLLAKVCWINTKLTLVFLIIFRL